MNVEIDKEEYFDWLKTSNIVEEEHCSFSSCCGPHSFTTEIEKNGNLYLLTWGWGWDRGNPEKHNYSIESLFRMPGQEGDGI